MCGQRAVLTNQQEDYNMKNKTNQLTEYIEEMGWGDAIRAYKHYGYNSPEFKAAELELQRRLAVANKESEPRRSWHREIVRKEGY